MKHFLIVATNSVLSSEFGDHIDIW